MKRKLTFFSLLLVGIVALSAHNLFIKPESYFLKPNTNSKLYVYNGTFTESHSILARKRMADVSLVNPGGVISHPDTSAWYDKDEQSILEFKTGNEGTAVLGISNFPRINEYTPEIFAENMKHEGLLDVLEERKKSGDASKPAKKKYAKHVKTVFQIGDKLSDDYKTILGYPVELIPMSNPYSINVGDQLQMKLLIDGKPMSGITVYASHNDQHGYAEDGTPIDAFKTKTDANGMVKTKITDAGQWYFRTVYLTKSTDDDADYVSNSASITFEIKK